MRKFNISLLLLMIFVISCSKNDESTIVENQSSEMLVINSDEDYLSLANKTLSMNLVELKAWEEANNFKSYGVTCDEFYNTIVPEKFKSFEEIEKFVNDNSLFIKITLDEAGEKSVEKQNYFSVYRYLINKDKMFQFNKCVYKVFDNGIASTTINNSTKLKNVDEGDILSLQNNPEYNLVLNTSDLSLKSTTTDCGKYYSNFKANDNERVVLKFDTYYKHIEWSGYWVVIHYWAYSQKRTLGVWFNCNRTMTVRLDIDILAGGITLPFKDEWINHSGDISGSPLMVDYGFDQKINPVFSRYYCTAHIPKPCNLTASCN